MFPLVIFNYVLCPSSSVDVSEALRLPGVVDVITAKDIPGNKVREMSGYTEELLADTEVFSLCGVYVFQTNSQQHNTKGL